MDHNSAKDIRSWTNLERASSSGLTRRGRKRDQYRLRPALQVLEDRRLLATFTVVSTADPVTITAGTLRWAVEQADAATTDSTIDFDLGGATATITLTQGELEVGHTSGSIAIDGPGANLLSISGNDASRVFHCLAGTTSISGLTITGGSASNDGGGLYGDAGSALTVSDCTISGNSAKYGGGVFSGAPNGSESIELDGCTISGNSASYSGGLLLEDIATLDDCTISDNSAGAGGGVGALRDDDARRLHNQR